MAVIIHRMTIATDRRSGESAIKRLPTIKAESFGMPDDFTEIEPGVWQRETQYPLTVVTDVWRAA